MISALAIADALKYNDSQERDEHGRFGSGSGGFISDSKHEALYDNRHVPDAASLQALGEYKGGYYVGINETLRTGEEKDPGSRARAAELDKVMAANKLPAMTVVRYASQRALDGVGPGDTFVDKGFVSTSSDKAYGGGVFSGGSAQARMEIDVPSGIRGVAMDDGKSGFLGGEHEILLDRGLSFRMVSERYERVGDRENRIVHLRVER